MSPHLTLKTISSLDRKVVPLYMYLQNVHRFSEKVDYTDQTTLVRESGKKPHLRTGNRAEIGAGVRRPCEKKNERNKDK